VGLSQLGVRAAQSRVQGGLAGKSRSEHSCTPTARVGNSAEVPPGAVWAGGSVALCSKADVPLPRRVVEECLELADAGGADLLLDLSYESSAEVLRPFRRPALIDIDPGLLQI
jgi:hypothetical protein